MSLSATIFGRDSFIFKATNVLGLGLPGLIDKAFGPKDVKGPRIGDLTVQTSSYGVEIGRVHGTIGIAGNLLWLENNQLKETTHKKKSGGKGGAAAAEPNVTFTYSATFAIGICEGPIDGIARIWCGDQLIYNAGSGDVSTIIASNKSAKGMRIHLGTDDQLPDSRYEAARGAGKTPSFRGLAYVVFDDFQLADYGNTLQAANFKFEVVEVSEYQSIRKLAGATSGVSFLDAFSSGPQPYVVSADGAIVVTDELGSGYTFGLDCHLIARTGSGPTLALSSAGILQSGFMNGDLVTVDSNRLNNAFGSASIITPSIYQSGLPQDHYLYGVCLSADGQAMVVITGLASGGSGAATGTNYYLLDVSGAVVSFGMLSVPVSIQEFGFGRTAQNHFVAGCLENDSIHLWTAYGAGSGDVCVYEIADGVLSLLKRMTNELYHQFTKPSILAVDGVAYIASGTEVAIFTRSAQIINDPPSLSEVIQEEVLTSDLIKASDIDTSYLTGTVRGYAVQGGTIRSAIEPLQTAFRFDVIQSGYQAKFIPRGIEPVMTIPWADLIANTSNSNSEAITEAREMDTQLPVKTTVKYLDAAREYSVSNQSFERLTTRAVGKKDVEIALVMTATEALQTAEVLTLLPWLERSSFSFKLPPSYQFLEPADVITLATPWAAIELRIGKIDYDTDGTLDCTATPNKASLYSSEAIADEPPPPIDTIGLPGPSMFVPLDIPLISEKQQSSPSFIGAMVGFSPAWTGAMLVQTDDNGQTWKNIQGFSGMSTLGLCENTLPVSASTVIDDRALIVRLIAGELESVTRDQMLAGVHYAAYGADTRWEIVRFQSADLQENGSYRVSGFVRGEKGTEWTTGLHQVNDYFVLLDDPDNISIDMSIESLLSPRIYRGVTLGSDLDSAADVPFTYRGVNLEPLSPVYPRAQRAGDGALTLSVQRRSRLSSSWWANGMEAPVGETTLALEADVMSGSTVKRTIQSSSGVFSYSAADQVSDFGAVQSSIHFRIYQLSTVVGRGYPLEVFV